MGDGAEVQVQVQRQLRGWTTGRTVASLAIAVTVVLSAAACTDDDGSAVLGAPVTASDAQLTTTIQVSATEPGPTEQVTATVTVTNTDSEPVDLPGPCRLVVAVVTEPADQVRVDSGSEVISQLFSSQYGNGVFLPPDRQTRPDVTLADLAAVNAGDLSPLIAKGDPCPGAPTSTTLAPGATIIATTALTVGELGLPSGPARITTVLPGREPEANPAIEIILPTPTADPVDRTTAIGLALSQPEVVALLGEIPPSAVEGATALAWRTEGGWQVGYAAGGQAVLVAIAADGTVTSVETSPSG